MKKTFLFCAATVFCGAVFAGETVTRLHFESPDAVQKAVVAHALGKDFVKGEGVFRPRLWVAEVDMNGDRRNDLVAVQQAFCSNHACTFHVLLNQSDGRWEKVAAIESWGIPFVIHRSPGAMHDLVTFDHLTDDCLACSPPKPVRLQWQTADQAGRAGKSGQFVEAAPLSEKEAGRFKASWDWQ